MMAWRGTTFQRARLSNQRELKQTFDIRYFFTKSSMFKKYSTIAMFT